MTTERIVELTYETIPHKYWPKCAWCGHDFGDFTLEAESPWGPMRICDDCREILRHQIMLFAPWVIGKFLAGIVKNKEAMNEFIENAQVKEFHTDDMLNLAVQNMKEAQEPEKA